MTWVIAVIQVQTQHPPKVFIRSIDDDEEQLLSEKINSLKVESNQIKELTNQ